MLAATLKENYHDQPDDLFLKWFAGNGDPMSENLFRLGSLEYYQFSSVFKTKTGRYCSAHGRSQNRKVAALKCAAEFVERKFMLDFFGKSGENLLPLAFHTSNGWAVHFNKAEAQKRSYLEALERHLLLRSYLAFGWQGFRLIQKIKSPEMDLYFLTSRYLSDGFISGLVVTKSPKYPGVSFGYCIGEEKDVFTAQFWESALFESVDRILTLDGEKIDLSADPKSWLRSEAKFYLENPFDLSLIQNESGEVIPIHTPEHNTKSFDISDLYGIPTPFYAAYSWGQDLIPIFHRAALSDHAADYLRNTFRRNGICTEIPTRHPVL